MNISEGIKPSDAINAQAIMNTNLVEHNPAPHLSYNFECFGPSDENRDEYLDYLFEAREAKIKGDLAHATRCEAKAAALVEKLWEDVAHNLVTNEGRDEVLDKLFKGSSYTAAWYLGLKGTGSEAAGDTLASHAGWSEVTPYSGNRPSVTWGTVGSQSLAASSAVSYSITGTATVAGAFLATVNTGTSGILYSAGDFAASRSVANGDTLNVTPTVTS